MIPIDLPFRAAADLNIVAFEVHGEIVLQLSGAADLRAADALREVLASTHEAARRFRVNRITVDITALEFMNSSCIKGIVSWLASIQAEERHPRYKVRFLTNPDMQWQRTSLKAIRCMVPELVTVEGRMAG